MVNDKKIIILLGDGMADYPIDTLQHKTPLEYAHTPHMDYLAKRGISGLVRTVPQGMQPGSDTANLSVFGYNPVETYTGRAPLEALNMGIDLNAGDVAFRCNMVQIENEIMHDFSAGHIASEFSDIVIKELSKHNPHKFIEYYAGVSYRNLVIWRNYPFTDVTTSVPPHDITDKVVTPYLPQGEGAHMLLDLMRTSRTVISESKAIRDARTRYKGNPTSIWLWGGGRRPKMRTLTEKYGLHGYTISAVDLIHGIGRAAGLQPIPVQGATGYIDTNYNGKVDALVHGLRDANYIFLHVEAPDESGHQGSLENKLKAIEDFDSKVVGRVIAELDKYDDYAILVMPDHPTPLSLMTHTDDPVPFVIYNKKGWSGEWQQYQSECYHEQAARNTGLYIPDGYRLIELMLQGKV